MPKYPTIYNKRQGGIPKGAIYCGRGSPWGNPFVIGRDGNRVEVINKFAIYASDRLRKQPDWLKPLRNAIGLVCWCAPQPCHLDIIVDMLNKE